MKKFFYLFSLLFIVASCTEDIKFNTPAFQGLKNNVFWRAQGYQARTETNGYLVIEGSLGLEKVTLRMPNAILGNYSLGVNNLTMASYANTFTPQLAMFTTGTNRGNGQIVITEVDNETKTISGTFKFTAENVNTADVDNARVTFTEGVFYKIPFSMASNF